jgi:hypothetical protein
MFSVLIRPIGTHEFQFRPALSDGAQNRVRRSVPAFGVLGSAIAAVVILIARIGAGS